MIETFDNKFQKVGDDIKEQLPQAYVFIAANRFSLHGYAALKKELDKANEVHFLFTRNFATSTKLLENRFERVLKNRLTQSYIAKECARWIEKKVHFKALEGDFAVAPLAIVEKNDKKVAYIGIEEFTAVGLGYHTDNALLQSIIKIADPHVVQNYRTQFEAIWKNYKLVKDITPEVLEYLKKIYQPNAPEFIYYQVLYYLFQGFVDDFEEEYSISERSGFKNSVIWNKLFDFQKDAVLGIINKLEKFNGCILADSVGLGKTFTALGVIKYYQERNKSILVLCPKKLGENWKTFLSNYKDNPLLKDRFNYDVLYHTDLLRTKGFSNGIDLSRINWSNYDLIVIDESHNFRNNEIVKDRKTRYQRLLKDVIKKGVQTKVLMLSATPVNNRLNDLKNQLALAFEGDIENAHELLGISKPIETILNNVQKIFNQWMKLPEEQRTSKELMRRLSAQFEFFKLLDSVTIARSRKHIEKYYDMEAIGKFPKRLKPISKFPPITDDPLIMSIKELHHELGRLNLSLYAPFDYILPSSRRFYEELYDTKVSESNYLRQRDRERSLKTLMRINFLKRLESSVHSFRLTLERFVSQLTSTIEKLERYDERQELRFEWQEVDDEENFIGEKVRIHLKDLNIYGWLEDLKSDLEVAQKILAQMRRITPQKDKKLQTLKTLIRHKLQHPITEGNKKILIFTAFADTAEYLYKNIKEYARDLGLHAAKIEGSNKNDATLPIDKHFNTILSHFSPRSKEADVKEEIDILIATDCISEGQNLQDCDMLVNYDIHWNPVRIIQRFGRIDRIGSPNEKIQLVNFWPEMTLDEYINLKARVEARMYMVDATATGEDNVLTNESADLLFRKKQLQKLQNEVIDLEEMDETISLTDLGLNDFRMDLVNLLKKYGDIKDYPTGLYTVIADENELEDGVVFVLKSINEKFQDKTNQLHPYYLVYVKSDGTLHLPHMEAKKVLDVLKSVCKNRTSPIQNAYDRFFRKTSNAKDMSPYRRLLGRAIESIMQTKEEVAIDSLFSKGGTVVEKEAIKGIDDFELIAYFIIEAQDDHMAG